jgi:ligand-binding SRPBCC domain-containing protein
MYVYEKRSIIECSVEELYAFHEDTNNLPHITPDGIKVTLLNEKIETKEGFVVKMKVKEGLLSFIWHVEFTKVESPHVIVDEARKSPFAFWKHEHRFTEYGEGRSLLHDRVSYTIPFGFFGKLFRFLVHYKLEKMFAFRHAKTKVLLEER